MPAAQFPPGFVWGAAAAAPQIEGAAAVDGRGDSTWDTFARLPGRIRNADTPTVACDHYHRFREDVALMAQLGLRHYRLSIAWPRVLPHGVGKVNHAGLAFYDRLVDTLLAHRITPWVTLFHWDLPQALEDPGGWRERATVDAFAEYAKLVVSRLGDRVKRWFTLNEIVCFTKRAYGTGEMAPGLRENDAVVARTIHHALLCHGHAVRAVREFGGADAQVGLVDNPGVSIPVTGTANNIAAARQVFAADNIRVLGPIYQADPEALYAKVYGRDCPPIERGDFELIRQRADFLGLNIYGGTFVRAGSDGTPEKLPMSPSYPSADCRWLKHTPEALYWGPRLVADLYGVSAVYITENGIGYEDDAVSTRGEILDLHRRNYLRTYLHELAHAIADGVPVRGYFVWSLLDNFEWQDGYATRFGIVHTDYRTFVRTPKLSAHWYREVIRQNTVR